MKLKQTLANLLAGGTLFLYTLFLGGCYDTPYLVRDASQAVIDDTILGRWISEKTTPLARGALIEVSREPDSPWYHIHFRDLETKEEQNLRAILHDIGDHRILSYNSSEDADYSVFRLEQRPDSPHRIAAFSLLENAPRFERREEFEAFLESNASHQWFRGAFIFDRIE